MTDPGTTQQRGHTPESERMRGFRPTARRRNRLAAGLALGAVAIGGNVLVYSSLDSSQPVVQIVRDVPAGDQITPDMLRTVDADIDPTVNVIPGADLSTLVGQYAKVRLISGSLVVRTALQPDPLLNPGSAVVAIEVKAAELPVGLRERVPVQLVIPGPASAGSAAATTIEGRVVGLPVASESGLGTRSVSLEVAAADASAVAAADDVRVVLMVPSEDRAARTVEAGE
jgi:hypothetical protein